MSLKLAKSLSNIDNRIENTYKEIENDFQITDIEEKGYFLIFYDLLMKIIAVVERCNRDKSGSIKKLICVEIGQLFVEKFFPEYLSHYLENVDETIEIIINSYKLLKKEKKTSKLFKKCYLKCFSFV